MDEVHLLSKCGCVCVCRVMHQEFEINSELFGWFRCVHNKEDERGMKTFRLTGKLGDDILVYEESRCDLLH